MSLEKQDMRLTVTYDQGAGYKELDPTASGEWNIVKAGILWLKLNLRRVADWTLLE